MSNISDLGISMKAGKEYEPVKEGKYDFLVHGIVFLGEQPNLMGFKNEKGELQKPSPQFKFIFELPKAIREDGLSEVMSLNVTASVSERGFYITLVSILLDKTMTPDEMADYVTSAGLKSLLGKAGRLRVVHWEKDGRKGAKIDRKGLYPHDEDREMPVAKRETFFFNPLQPDMNIFKNVLTHWTRKEIMQAVNAKDFCKEIHQEWARELEERAAKGKDDKKKKVAIVNEVKNDTYAIE